MKKYTPYVFPLVVMSILFMLVFRWYTLRAERSEYALLGEGIEIENLSQEELVKSITGVGDYESVTLDSQDPDYTGVVRYEIKDEKIRFSVMANLPETTQEYSVWLKAADGTAMRQVFALVAGKGGFIGSAALPSQLLPLEVIVSTQDEPESADVEYLLRGTITAGEQTEIEVLQEELN